MESQIHKFSKNLGATSKLTGARLGTWNKFHAEDTISWRDLCTSLLALSARHLCELYLYL